MSYSGFTCRTNITSEQRIAWHGAWEGEREDLFERTRYVDNASSKNQKGTPRKPYHTVEKAVDKANSGDYLFIRSGTYSEAITITKQMHIRRWDLGSGSAVIGSN